MPTMLPRDIYAYLSARVLGQDDVLQKIAVAIYKHVAGIKWGNILLIGNSGTGKTTIMKTIRQFFDDYEELRDFRTMAILNANTLVDEEGEVNTSRIFKNLEDDAKNVYGQDLTAEGLRTAMERATVCFDEIDKITSRIAGRTNVTGIAIQQALLTILEGERVYYDAHLAGDGGSSRARFSVDTGKMLFICGGAFEELYDQVYTLMEERKDERRLIEESYWDEEAQRIQRVVNFSLRRHLKLEDLFTYGMVPQFISRFSSIAILDDLKKPELRQIMLAAKDSPYLYSKSYFASLGIDLVLEDDALDLITTHAVKNTRIGARALREVFSRIIAELEFDPFGSNKLEEAGGGKRIVIDKATVKSNLS